MNIVEAYKKFNGTGLIVIISGMSGSGTSVLCEKIANDFDLEFISYRYYTNFDGNKTITINGKKKKNWDMDESVNWDLFVKGINDKKNNKNGVVVRTVAFPKKYIEELGDNDVIHVHIKLSKVNLLKKRLDYMTKNGKTDNNVDIVLNKYSFPYYVKITNNDYTRINKYVNGNSYCDLSIDDYNEKIYNDTFDYLISYVNKWLHDYENKENVDTDENDYTTSDEIDNTTDLDSDI